MRDPLINREEDECSCPQHQLALNIPELRVCSCGAPTKNPCRYDAHWEHRSWDWRRPKDCLNRPNPATDPFPAGY